MRPSRLVLLVWTLVVVVLVVLEVAEVTRRFTLPIQLAVNDPIVLFVSLVFTTIVAVIGAIFIGISITTRLLSPQGFTPFEEEMLRMRADLQEVRRIVSDLKGGAAPPPAPGAPKEPAERSR